MKLLLAADMEGVAGVVHWNQVTTTHLQYGRFRSLLMGEINAAAQGAYDAGATEVFVSDGHAQGWNLLIEELDPRVHLNAGASSPFSMVQGIHDSVNGVIFIGYHARMGTQAAILDHTWSDERVANLWLNDRLCGETGLNGALCGHFGVPVILVSGDQAVCAEAREWLGDVETAIIKHGSGRMSAGCLAVEASRQVIYTAAFRAVTRLSAGRVPAPLRLETPIRMMLEFVRSDLADRAASLPGVRRGPGCCVEYIASEMPEVYKVFRALLVLAWEYQ